MENMDREYMDREYMDREYMDRDRNFQVVYGLTGIL